MPDRFGNISIEPSTSASPLKQRKKRSPKRTGRRLPRRPRRQAPKSLIGIVIVLLLAGSYSAAGFWGVPKYITSSLPNRIREQSGMLLSVGKARFNPFTFALSVGDVTLRQEAASEKPLLSLASFTTKLAPLSLLRGEFVCTRLQAEKLVLHIIRAKDGSYNFSHFFQKGQHTTPTEMMNFSELPFRFSLNNISVTNSRLSFDDIPKNSHHIVDKINLALPNFSNFGFEASEYIHPRFSAVVDGSPIELAGQAAIGSAGKTAQTDLSCSFSDINLPLYFAYLPFHPPLKITKGKGSGTLRLSFTPGAAERKISIDFTLETRDMEMEGSKSKLTLEVPSAKFEGSIQPATGDTHLTNVILRQPALTAQSGAVLDDLADLLVGSAGKSSATGKSRVPAIAMDRFIAYNGTLSIAGKKGAKPTSGWKTIQLSITHFSNNLKADGTTEAGHFLLTGQQTSSRATLNWQGRLNGHNLPSGKLRLVKLDAASLFDLLGLAAAKPAEGTADVEANLALKEAKNKTRKVLPVLTKGAITLHDIALGAGKSPWYRAKLAKLTGVTKTGHTVSLGNAYLDGGTVRIDLSDPPALLAAIAAKNSTASLNAMQFTGSLTLHHKERTIPDLHFDTFSLRAIHLADREKTPGSDNLSVKATLADKGNFQARGTVRLAPLSVSLLTGFTQLHSSQLLPWFSDAYASTHTSGLLSGKGTLTYPELAFSGQLQLQNGKLTLGGGAAPFSWRSLEFTDFRYARKPFFLGATNCTFQAPLLHVVQSEKEPPLVGSLLDFLGKLLPAPAKSGAKADVLPTMKIQRVAIASGNIDYADERLNPTWKGRITSVSGTLDNLIGTSDASASSFSLTAQLDTIPFTLEGAFHPFERNRPGQATLSLSNYPLPAFKDQLTHLLAIDPNQGNFTLLEKSSWQDGLVSESCEMQFSNVHPASKDADTALTLALLNNDDHQFSLTCGSQQKLEQQGTSLFSEAITIFRKMMVKASLSPYLLATGEFSDLVDQSYAEFLPGRAQLTGQGQEVLTRFSNLMSAHPDLKLVVTGSADARIDGAVLKQKEEQAQEQRVSEENKRRSEALEKAREKRRRQLSKAGQGNAEEAPIVEQNIPADQLSLYAPIKEQPVIINRDKLEHLARERAQYIVDFFVHRLGLQPARIQTAEQPRITDSPDALGNRVPFALSTVEGAE